MVNKVCSNKYGATILESDFGTINFDTPHPALNAEQLKFANFPLFLYSVSHFKSSILYTLYPS